MTGKQVRIQGAVFTVPADELTDPHPDAAGKCKAVEPDWSPVSGGSVCTIGCHPASTAHVAHDGDRNVIAIWND
jgi:hypothetical protein